MVRSSGLAGLLLLILACSTGARARAATLGRNTAGDRQTKTGFILAKVSSGYCHEDTTLYQARVSSTSAQSVSVLSAAAMQAVTTVASAAGLAYHKEVATPCWVLLKGANGNTAATTAAIMALQQPHAEVMTAAAAASGPVIEYAFEEMYSFATTALPTPASSRRSTAKQQHPRSITANSMHRRLAARPVPTAAGLPDECSSGTCDSLWGMNRIKAPELWKLLVDQEMMPLPQTGFLKGMVLDGGVDFLHNDIKGQVDIKNSRTFNAASNNFPAGGRAAADASHGTHCFGTMAGNWSPYDNHADRRGIAGVVGPAYGNIVSCNAFGNADGAADSDLSACIRHAVRVKAHYAINMSLGRTGAPNHAKFWLDTFAPFCKAGGIAVVAAGNDHVDVDDPYPDEGSFHYYPAYAAAFYPDCVLTVAAIGQDNDQLTDFSNYGQLVGIAAPGAGILSDVNTAGSDLWTKDVYKGTSMAAPHVTGATLLLRNLFPTATNKQIVSCIVSSADLTVKPYNGSNINGGVLNVLAAYNCLASGSVDPPPPSPKLNCSLQQQVAVPACVDQANGVEDRACIPSAAVYCLPVGSSTCSFPYKPSGTVCNTATRADCSGSSAECPGPRPPATMCRNPPELAVADWEKACYSGIETRETCSAECSSVIGYYGDGYTTTCRADGTWSKPKGSCAYRFPSTKCDNNCQVASCDGCYCSKDNVTNHPKCKCDESQGLFEWRDIDTETGNTHSSCRWNLQSVKGYLMSARRGSKVLFESNIYGTTTNSTCPSSPVVTDVQLAPLEACEYPDTAYARLRPAAGQPLTTETCGKLPGHHTTRYAYAFQVNNPPGSKNMCANMTVSTSDDIQRDYVLRYIN